MQGNVWAATTHRRDNAYDTYPIRAQPRLPEAVVKLALLKFLDQAEGVYFRNGNQHGCCASCRVLGHSIHPRWDLHGKFKCRDRTCVEAKKALQ